MLGLALLGNGLQILNDFRTAGSETITRTQVESMIEEAIATAPYPWKEDRALVMAHIESQMIHEAPEVKMDRIREIVDLSLDGTKVRLDALHEDIGEIKKAVAEKGD